MSGSFAAASIGSGDPADSLQCSHDSDGQVWNDLGDQLIGFWHSENGTARMFIPQLVSLRQNRITFIGTGGCGEGGQQRISILARDP